MKKNLFLTLLCLLITNYNCSFAQNIQGETSISSTDKNKQEISESSKPVPQIDNKNIITELPDMPEVIDTDQNQQSNQINKIDEPVQISIKSERLSVGTKLKIFMNTNLNAKTNHEGDPFSAIIKDDVIVNKEIIIPSGTLIRGRVDKIKKPGFFHKNGLIYLTFDHIVTPLGKQLSFDAGLQKSDKVNENGALSGGKNLSEKIIENAISSYNTAKAATKAGYDIGMSAGKVPVIVTTPIGAAIGGVAGTSLFATKTTIALFKKGGNVVINPGELFEVNFLEDIDVPVN